MNKTFGLLGRLLVGVVLFFPVLVVAVQAAPGLRVAESDQLVLERSYREYSAASQAWAVSRQRFYEPKDAALEARYAEAKMHWEHAKSEVAIAQLTSGGNLAAGWEDGAQFDLDFQHIVHADDDYFLIYLPEDMRHDWSIELYLPR